MRWRAAKSEGTLSMYSGRGLPGVIPGWARSVGGRIGDVTGPRRAGPVPGVG